MTQSKKHARWSLKLVSSLVIVAVTTATRVQAQVTPDGTLGTRVNDSTSLPCNGGTCTISGGTPAGTNLFHSFQDFSVPTSGTAHFDNIGSIQNIINRVTGLSGSNIDGTISANGKANVFLINPNGIIFGPNAQLAIGGSFVATTANAIGFGTKGYFGPTTGNSVALLTVNPSAFLFNQIAAAPITNQSVAGLQVPGGQSLVLLGGDVSLDGGGLVAPGGRVELGGVAGTGTVALNVDGNNLSLSFPVGVPRADISLTNGAAVDASGSGGGDIQVQGRQVVLTGGSRIVSVTLGSKSGGTLAVNASDSVELSGTTPNGQSGSSLFTSTEDAGAAGDLSIATGKLIVRDGAQVSAGTFEQGQGGNLSIHASDLVEVIGWSADGKFPSRLVTQVESKATGAAGNLSIATGKLIVRDGAQVYAATFGQGQGGNLSIHASDLVELIGLSADGKFPSRLSTQVQPKATGAAGNLSIATGKLIVRDGAQVSAGTFEQGQGGNLSIHASDLVEVIGWSADGKFPSRLFTQVESKATGAAGNLSIATRKLIVRDGAQVYAATFGQGRGGNLSIHASDLVEVIGRSADDQVGSRLFTGVASEATGAAGNLSIATGKLIVRDGAQVSASTFGQGRGGNLSIHASDLVEVIGQPSGLFTQVNLRATGAAGNLSIATGKLIVRDRAIVSAATLGSGEGGSIQVESNSLSLANHGQISSSSAGTGNAGNIQLQANSISLDSGTFISTDKANARGGNITLQTQDLQLRDKSKITNNASGQVNGGLTSISAQRVMLENSQITSETASGKGGDIRLDAGNLLLRYNSLISTTAGNNQNGGDGGNIDINTKFIVAVPKEDSDISANAFTGRGGNIQIAASGIFGIQFRPQNTPLSDITASSTLGVQGVVNINTPGINPTRGLGFLPAQPAPPDIPQVCKPGAGQADSEFINTGRGGKPPSPSETLSSNPGWVDLSTSTPRTENPSGLARVTQPRSPTTVEIVEAQGWVRGRNGEVILTASAPRVTPYSSWSTPAACSGK